MINKEHITIEKVNPSDTKLIQLIAEWYHQEWNIPATTTTQKINSFKENSIPLQIVVKENNIPIATGGIYTHVGLLDVFPEYKKYNYWLALVYTVPEKRNHGIGALLCNALEEQAKRYGIEKLFLFTYTAEKLYLKLNWTPIERFIYKENDTVIMEKNLS